MEEKAILEFIDEPVYTHVNKKVVYKIYSDEEIEKYNNTFFTEEGIDIITTDTDVYTSDDKLLLKFRKSVIPEKYLKTLYNNMKSAAQNSGGRAEAAGKEPGESIYKTQVSKNGKILRLLRKKVRSGIVGYYDNRSMYGHRVSKNMPCRMTAFTAQHFEKFKDCIQVFQVIDKLYEQLVPEKYKLQKQMADRLNPNYVITDTSFTTVTVNKNFRTALHKDKGDFIKGFGNLLIVSQGNYNKGYTLFPQYGIGVDCRDGDFLAMDVHEWHCNAPIDGDGIRFSFVLYLREKMIKLCSS